MKEIVLVDDGSENDEIKTILPLYIKYRLHKYPGKCLKNQFNPIQIYDFTLDLVTLHRQEHQLGQAGAGQSGAIISTGDILVFLDSHCEVK